MPEQDVQGRARPFDVAGETAQDDASKHLSLEAWESVFGKSIGKSGACPPEALHKPVEGEPLKGRVVSDVYVREKRDDSEVLHMPGKHRLVVKEDGSWYLRGPDGPISIVPRNTMEMRYPEWSSLSNGGRVTYYPDRTEITMPGGDRIAFDANGIKSVMRGQEAVRIGTAMPPMERSGSDLPAKDPGKKLSTGDSLRIEDDHQILQMPNGEKLVVGEDGKWYIRNASGPVSIIPQTTFEMRIPQWNDLSNGGRVTFHDNQTEITFANGDSVRFNSEGIIAVARGNQTAVLRNVPLEQKDYFKGFTDAYKRNKTINY